MNDKTYVPKCRAKERDTKFGPVLNVSFDAKELIAFVQSHTNERGYFNISIMPRKSRDESQTHSVVWDNWEPQKREPSSEATQSRRDVAQDEPPNGDDQRVPF